MQNSKYLSNENGSCKSPITRMLFVELFSDWRNSFTKSCSDFVSLSLYSFNCFISFLFFQYYAHQSKHQSP